MERAFSTMGGPTILGIYLMLLIFPCLSFGFKKIGLKSIFYFGSAVFLIISLISSATRSAILGFAIGVLFFTFFYPKKSKKVNIIKIAAGAFIILSIFGLFLLKSRPELVSAIERIPLIGNAFHRTWSAVDPLLDLKNITFEKIVTEGRYSGWQVLWPALKDRPILGYGPDNISIPFDKNYDPSIKGISVEMDSSSSGWWDRAHNIFLELGITIGIPGLIAYLLIFIMLFLKLQKSKKEKPILSLGIQSAFIAYLISVFFNFDSFSTYLVVFSLIGYALFLTEKEPEEENPQNKNSNAEANLWKYITTTVILLIFAWFIWTNINALLINKKVNEVDAIIGIDAEKNNCQGVIQLMDSILAKHSFIDNYVRLKYSDDMSFCIDAHPELTVELSKKTVSFLQEAQKLRPHYTRTWTYSAVFLNKIIENSGSGLSEEQKQELAGKALADLEKSEELSPKRTDLYLTWIKTYLLLQDYDNALKKADQCIELNPDVGDCYWARGLSLIVSGESKSQQAIDDIKKGVQLGYSKDAYNSLSQLIKVYQGLAEKTQDKRYYEILETLFLEKINFDNTKFQDHATLAYIYSVLGEYDKAREEAAIVLKLSPDSKTSVEEFLKTLPQ
jgi:tetratricopeptide (TPR) repeat protein